MRKILSLIIVALITWSIFGQVLFAQKGEPKGGASSSSETEVIDVTADVVFPYKINDTTEVMCLVGNFAAQHNGAVITADSAVRYNDKRLECFGKVLINKNTTYGYADRAEYNGELNEVELFAPIVKVVDGDATLYTYNFRFNTMDNIGYYDGGGVMINGDDVMESITGYFYSDDNEIIGVGDVELRGSDYQMTSDSIIYNTDTESARYFKNSNIWNEKDEYLYADLGDYDKAEDRYSFDLNGYILTDEQEMWSDSMDYYRTREHVFMRSNVQIDDTTQKSLIFADYGEHLSKPGNTYLYGRPVVISYDEEQGDSLFMRADTIQIFTLERFERDSISSAVDSLATDSLAAPKSAASVEQKAKPKQDMAMPDATVAVEPQMEEKPQVEQNPMQSRQDSVRAAEARLDSLRAEAKRDVATQRDTTQKVTMPSDTLPRDTLINNGLDSLELDSMSLDSIAMRDSLALAADTLTFIEKKMAIYNKWQAERRERRAVEQAARKIVLDSIGRERQKIINAKLDAEKVKEAERLRERYDKAKERAERKRARAIARGKISEDDSTHYQVGEFKLDSTFTTAIARDSVARVMDSLARDSVALDSLAPPALDSLAVDSLQRDTMVVDSTYKLVKGFRNVKMYRSDFQSVADSVTFSSIDSVIRMYIEPVLWHENNQVTSDVMDIYTANQQVDKAVFTGKPFMSSNLDSVYYNQVTGKEMTALFRDGELYRNDVEGNAQTIYYMQDEDTGEVNSMMVLESGSTTFFIADQTVEGITYRSAPTYVLYPMKMVPADQPPMLDGFSWQSERRPERDQIMDRVRRPSQREEKRELPRPKFPINTEFESLRERLTQMGMWADRTDVVSAHIEEWLESLGYKSGQPREEE